MTSSLSSEEFNVFKFEDASTSVSTVQSYHPYSNTSQPIVIDNGSYKCRAGWAASSQPELIFKNQVAKQRGKKEYEVAVGNEVDNVEIAKWQIKSHFDKNIVTQYDVQENIFDHIFHHLGITSSSIDHPIVLTEAICNPTYFRQQMTELLFECYNIPRLAFGVDSLFSFYRNHPSSDSCSGLIVSCGHQTTHILPVLDDVPMFEHCRRINLGGAHVAYFMQRLLQLKYPAHVNTLTAQRAEELVLKHTYCALNYKDELKKWAENDYFMNNVHKIQLNYNVQAAKVISQEQQKSRREQHRRQLKKLNAKAQEKFLIQNDERLEELANVQLTNEDEDDEDSINFDKLKKLGFETVQDLQDEIKIIKKKINKNQQRILEFLLEFENESGGFNSLSPLAREIILKNTGKKSIEQVLKDVSFKHSSSKKQTEENKDSDITPPTNKDEFESWLENIRETRQNLIEKRKQRKLRREQQHKRGTYASQQRMKIITQLADSTKKKSDDTFGQNDDDWNVYKSIQKNDENCDSDDEQEKIDELESVLREYDKEYKSKTNPWNFDIREHYRLYLGTERIRAPEILFQPSMIGSEQAGILETIDFVLKKFSTEDQLKLAQYVFLTGGPASFFNLKERLHDDLQSIRPVNSEFSISLAENPELDSWYGACDWSKTSLFNQYSITRKDYEEFGGEFLKENKISNLYKTMQTS